MRAFARRFLPFVIPFTQRLWRPPMSSEQSSTPKDGAKKSFPWIDALADRLVSTGLSWTRQSLSMTKRVLETSAKTLSQTAGSLDEWEKKLERPKADASEPPAATA
jgi:hypothetical protein